MSRSVGGIQLWGSIRKFVSYFLGGSQFETEAQKIYYIYMCQLLAFFSLLDIVLTDFNQDMCLYTCGLVGRHTGLRNHSFRAINKTKKQGSWWRRWAIFEKKNKIKYQLPPKDKFVMVVASSQTTTTTPFNISPEKTKKNLVWTCVLFPALSSISNEPALFEIIKIPPY